MRPAQASARGPRSPMSRSRTKRRLQPARRGREESEKLGEYSFAKLSDRTRKSHGEGAVQNIWIHRRWRRQLDPARLDLREGRVHLGIERRVAARPIHREPGHLAIWGHSDADL